MTARPSGRRYATITAALIAVVLAGCAAPADSAGDPGPSSTPVAVTTPTDLTTDTRVPALVGGIAELVDKKAFAAGVVPIIEHRVDIDRPPGTVISVEPPSGTAVPYGSVVTVVVAGPPAAVLDDQIRARRRTFIGVAAEPDGTMILALVAGADRDKALDEMRPFLTSNPYRIVECATSWAELEQIRVRLAQRDFLPHAAQRSFVSTLDPAACAVRLQGNFTEAEATALRDRFGRSLIVEWGDAGRRPRR